MKIVLNLKLVINMITLNNTSSNRGNILIYFTCLINVIWRFYGSYLDIQLLWLLKRIIFRLRKGRLACSYRAKEIWHCIKNCSSPVQTANKMLCCLSQIEINCSNISETLIFQWKAFLFSYRKSGYFFVLNTLYNQIS